MDSDEVVDLSDDFFGVWVDVNSDSNDRLTLLKNKAIATSTDIAIMNQIKQNLDRAMDFGELIIVTPKLVSFLTARLF